MGSRKTNYMDLNSVSGFAFLVSNNRATYQPQRMLYCSLFQTIVYGYKRYIVVNYSATYELIPLHCKMQRIPIKLMSSKAGSSDDTALSRKRLCRPLCSEMFFVLPNERRYIYEGAMLQLGVWWSSIGVHIKQAVGKDSKSKPHQSLLCKLYYLLNMKCTLGNAI